VARLRALPFVAQPPLPTARRSLCLKQVPPSCNQLPTSGAWPSLTSRLAAFTVLRHCDPASVTKLVTLFATRVPRALRSCGCSQQDRSVATPPAM